MLLTTPTFLSFLKESSLRTNNSSSHIISHCIFITPSLLLSLSPSLTFFQSFPPLPFLQLLLSPFRLLPCSSSPQFTLSLTSQSCIDLHNTSAVISPYLLTQTYTHTHSIYLTPCRDVFIFTRMHVHTFSLPRDTFFVSVSGRFTHYMYFPSR